MSYQVGVDVGGTFTTAAVARGGRAEVVSVVPSQLPGVPRGFLRRVGDDTPVLVGTRPVPAETLVARLVSQVVSTIGTPARLAVTHPVTWGPHRVAALRSALGEVTMLSTAAAVAYRSEPPVAVHDLGGSTFTAAVVRGLATAGQPLELDLGGADLDELVFDHVRTALGDDLPTDATALSHLRQACTTAKEALSADTEVEIPVVGQGIDTRVRLTRAEFEDLARPLLTETAAALRMTIEESGLTPATVLLAGGAAWLPLLTQVVSAELGRPVTATPRGAAAMGAALAAGDTGFGATGAGPARSSTAPGPARPVVPQGNPGAAAMETGRPNTDSTSRDKAGATGQPAASRPATPSAAGRGNPPTRLAGSLEPPAGRAAGTRTPPAAGEVRTSLVEPVRPPVPTAAAPTSDKVKRSRTMVAAAVAVFVVVGAAAAVALTAGQTPPGAGAEPMPTTTTVFSTVPETTTIVVPPAAPAPKNQVPQQKTQRNTQVATTTTTTTAPVTTTTPTTSSTTTTTDAPSSARTLTSTEGGER
jgi:hypothetical protein